MQTWWGFGDDESRPVIRVVMTDSTVYATEIAKCAHKYHNVPDDGTADEIVGLI